MKNELLLLSVFAAFLAPAAHAATLSELNGPLLNIGQWRLDTEADLYAAGTKSESNTIGSTGNKRDIGYTNYTLAPAGTYGLTDELQLKLSESYHLPYNCSYETIQVPGAATDHYKQKLKFQNSLTGYLKWRPSEPWEFYFKTSRSNSENVMKAWKLPYGSGTINDASRQVRSQEVTAGATWLSSPEAGGRTARNRADLDGLFGSFLNKNQTKADLSLSYDWGYSRANQKSTRTSGTVVYSASRSESHTFYAAPTVVYGILEQVQVEASADLFIPQRSEVVRDHQTGINSLGVVTGSDSAVSRSRQLAGYFPSLKLTHRLNRQFQWYLSGDYNYSKERNSSATIDELTGVTDGGGYVRGSESASAAIGLNWITAPKLEGRPLAADLDGLERPLLEKGQFKLEISLQANRERNWDSGDTSDSQAYRLYSSKVSYGATQTLQVYVLLDVIPRYTVQNDPSVKETYLWNPTCGAGATWRPGQTFQVFASAAVTPADISKGKHYDPAGALDSTGKTTNNTTTASVGAVFLW